jgi:uncharacterized protein YbcI
MAMPVGGKSESVSAMISTEMVGLYKELFGRGPTKARTQIFEDVILCTLEDTLTKSEKNMAKLQEHQRLREIRLFFQHSSEGEFRGTIEKITGRKVRAFVSGMDTAQDVAAELFYLEPVDLDGDKPSGPVPTLG